MKATSEDCERSRKHSEISLKVLIRGDTQRCPLWDGRGRDSHCNRWTTQKSAGNKGRGVILSMELSSLNWVFVRIFVLINRMHFAFHWVVLWLWVFYSVHGDIVECSRVEYLIFFFQMFFFDRFRLNINSYIETKNAFLKWSPWLICILFVMQDFNGWPDEPFEEMDSTLAVQQLIQQTIRRCDK